VEHAWLRLDDLGNRLSSAFRQGLAARRQKFTAACARFDRAAPERRVQFDSQRLLGLWKRLQAASPDSVLQRGFAIVRDAQGAPIMRRAAIAAGARLQAQFADGTAALRAE
jgi:exodeoxyribonuclease VII large subunit